MSKQNFAAGVNGKTGHRVLVIQHVECEPPAAFEDVLVDRGIEIDRIELDRGDTLPDWRLYDAIIAMGGPMGAVDDHEFPWLVDERKFIEEAVSTGTPYWGVCLGAQLLAASFGAEIYTGEAPEVGMNEVALTAAAERDPVFSQLPSSFPVFQWHSDSFVLPEGFSRLCESKLYENQAIARGAAYGVQFHVEVTESLAAEWGDIPEYKEALESIHGEGASQKILEDLRLNIDGNMKIAKKIFSSWLDNFVDR
ncbi:type 1 glutamine amidotransferase [Rhodococcus sp. ACT016]|uniref:type 1 glutamine amidotransferase n=1 Tax=Rhodococcus sp. ACT016 TaxID=3134808 RepID=UPI003D2DBBEB